MRDTTIYFVRHGETDYNRNRIMQGRRINSSLNDVGIGQAAALAERFAGVKLDVIYTSTLRRAIETADAVAEHHPGVPRHTLAGLDEMCWGIYEGEPYSDRLQMMLDEMYARWSVRDFGYRVEEGESIYEVQERCTGAVEKILRAHVGGNILVVSHGRLLRVLLATILEAGLERMNEFHHENTCVNILTYNGVNFKSDLLNCTAHLAETTSEVLE